MTKNNFKIALVAILAVGLIGSSVVFSQNATGQTFTSTLGKTEIRDDFRDYSDDPVVSKVTVIMNELNAKGLTESKMTYLAEQLSEIKQTTTSTSIGLADQKMELLSNIVASSTSARTLNLDRDLPILGMYVDENSGALVVHVDAMVYDKKSKSVAKQVRNIVGSEIDLIIEPMTPIRPHACSQTSNCEPAQAGVKIATPGDCTLGFKAKYNNKIGFVTAGHCNGGSSSGTVGQPNWWYGDHIGDVKKNTYAMNTKFDGMFVEADESISDKIYNNNDVNSLGYSSYGDGVTMEGFVTKGKFGVVISSSYNTWTYPQGAPPVYLKDMVVATYDGEPGDSGAPVWGYTPSKNFHGIHHGGNDYFSIFSKQSNAFSGLSWIFN